MATSCSSSSKLKPAFSSNWNENELERGEKELEKLLVENGGRWSLISSGKGIERSFKFKGFKKCWEFMNTVAPECTRQKHHPEWSNVYNTTFVRWTTHSPPGLSEKDITMAAFCDQAAEACGEVEQKPGEDKGHVGRELVGRVVEEGGDCCVPKGKGTGGT